MARRLDLDWQTESNQCVGGVKSVLLIPVLQKLADLQAVTESQELQMKALMESNEQVIVEVLLMCVGRNVACTGLLDKRSCTYKSNTDQPHKALFEHFSDWSPKNTVCHHHFAGTRHAGQEGREGVG